MEYPDYIELYDGFMDSYQAGTTSAEECGLVIARLTQSYCAINMALGSASVKLYKVHEQLINGEENGKPISASKAEILAKATDENTAVDALKRDLANVEQCINSLKALQKGLMNEYSHMGN